MKHIFRRHDQGADHLANLGTEGRTKISIEVVKNTEVRTAVRTYWDGSKKEDGRCGCRIVNQSRRQGEVDHTTQNCSTVESMHGHGCGNCRASVLTEVTDRVFLTESIG